LIIDAAVSICQAYAERYNDDLDAIVADLNAHHEKRTKHQKSQPPAPEKALSVPLPKWSGRVCPCH